MTKKPSLTDIDAESGSRLPFVKRETLSGEALKVFDNHASPGGDSLAGLRGPGGIKLHSPNLVEYSQPLGSYLRHHAGFELPIRECAIMIAAREMDSRFEWAAHEPEGLRVGLSQVLIDFGRELIRDKHVSTELFAQARQIFGEQILVDLVMLMGQYCCTALLLAAFEVQLPDGTEAILPVD
jgi:4-carboxymuconolactone decarboxylase